MAYTSSTSTSSAETGGSQITLGELVDKARTYLEDWDFEDALGAAVANDTITTITVGDYTKYATGNVLQIDDEYMVVSADPSSSTVSVARGRRGSTAAAHADGSRILRSTAWTHAQLADWINESFAVMYPTLYIRQTATLTGSDTDFTYTMPDDFTEETQAEFITLVNAGDAEPKITGITFRGEPPVAYVPRYLSGYDLLLQYVKPFGPLANDAAASSIPEKAKLLPVYYACAQALEQKEAKRSRYNAYEGYQDERIAREGQQIQTGSYYWQKFNALLNRVRMPRRSFI